MTEGRDRQRLASSLHGHDRAGSDRSPRILVILMGLIGDTMMKIPFVRALREKYPASHITGLCEPLSAPLLEADPLFDAVRILERRGLGYRDQARFYWSLRRSRFDMTLDFYFGARTPFLAWITGAKRRIGPATSAWARRLLTDPIEHPLPQVHMVDRHLVILAPLGITSFRRIWELPLPLEMPAHLRDKLVAAGIGPAPRPDDIVVGVGAGCVTKRWDGAYLDQAIRRFGSGELGQVGRVLVVADQREPSLTRRWEGVPGVVVLPPLTLLELGALFNSVGLVFVPDSGLMHIALARAPRLLTFFQSTDPAWHDAQRPAYRYLYHVVCPYQPCDTEDKDKCQLECRRSLGVDEVLDAVRQLLAEPAWDGQWPENRISLDQVTAGQTRTSPKARPDP